jgi:YbbR domain-containing protein
VRRIAGILFRNWPLKLGAIVLATVLYSGLVLGQTARTFTGTVPVDAIRLPAGAALLNQVEPVTTIRYRAPLEVGVLSPDRFRATIDLSDVQAQPGGPPVAVPVTLIALDQLIQIVDFQPREVQVQLDPVTERELPVSVSIGTVPDSVSVGPPQVDPATVTIRGASSRVDSVSQVLARVAIDASALNVDRLYDLVALDLNGNEVPSVEIEPQRVRVRIAVAQELATRSLPVVPQLVGTPAPGYRITAVTVEPLVVTVSGEAATVSHMENAPTAAIDVSDRTSDLEADVTFALPAGVTASEADRVRVVLTIEEEIGAQTYSAGVTLTGELPGYTYALDVQQVNVTLSGPLVELQAVNPATLVVTADVAPLDPGRASVALALESPGRTQLVGIDPGAISVSVSAPLLTPEASPATSPDGAQ